ncbi:MAG: Gfo/Idh/MocA family oxidoreductase [Rhodothermales bacterium]|nr:Gfo/Idh/MocA family oxidoreductase [Rhodothermales bacterium]
MKRPDDHGLSRRSFLKKSSLVLGLAGAVEIPAEAPAVRPARPADAKPMNLALLGFGPWGREIASTLERLPEVHLAAVSDPYDVMLRRVGRSYPEARTETDYRVLLDDPAIDGVIIATPTHTHRQLAVDALQAGKHVYCEAPLAHTIDDARAIARAAAAAEGQIFQSGLQYRSDPQYRSVFGFIRSGAVGRATMVRGQWHAKESWRRASPNREREREQNWRLDADLSPGLLGEIGIHQLDVAAWFLGARPVSATGFGQIMLWDDGRTVPDTVQAVLAFPDGTRHVYDATLASSFDGRYELFFGSDSTIMLRDSKGWMFKEVDAPVLGWEVYARKDTFYKEKGIALVANATKLEALGQDPAADDPNAQTPLWHALKAFHDNFTYGPFPPAAGPQEGFEATVVALKANEAVLAGGGITISEADLAVG